MLRYDHEQLDMVEVSGRRALCCDKFDELAIGAEMWPGAFK